MLKSLLAAAAVLAAPAASAVTISWIDWKSHSPSGLPSGSAQGTIAAPGGNVGVSFSGPFHFVQLECGFDYWFSGTYAGSFNKPTTCDLVALGIGGTAQLSFSQPVSDVYLALMSWNGNNVEFGTPIEVASEGPGFWGSGSFTINSAGTGFLGVSEVHGIIKLPGTFSSISFTHETEFWHGFTVGIRDIARVPDPTPVIPEPGTWALLIAGFGLVGASIRRRRAAHA